MRSILQDKRKHYCYLCAKLRGDRGWQYNLQEHHVFEGTADRQISEKMGLKIYLCPKHHMYSPEAIHGNSDIRHLVEKEAQIAWMRWWMKKTFGTKQEAYRAWMESMGKNYVDEEEWDP